ncbi:unnamed protein product [Schistosoma turkestanicum]|nr:unnamed protein product [Schistosoma turkestanicum]
MNQLKLDITTSMYVVDSASTRQKSSRVCHRVQNNNRNPMEKQSIKSRSKTNRLPASLKQNEEPCKIEVLPTKIKSQSTGLVYDERMLKHKHEWFIEEQESPRRISQAFHRCLQENLISRCIRVPACPIDEQDLLRIHDKQYVEKIKQSCSMSKHELYSLSGEYDGVFFNRIS